MTMSDSLAAWAAIVEPITQRLAALETRETRIANTSLNEYVVTEYGFVGDGVTDNSNAMNALLARAGRGATFLFPRPAVSYMFRSNCPIPRTNDYCLFKGLGAGEYISAPNTQGGSILRKGFGGPIFTVHALGCRFDSLGFDCGSPTWGGATIEVNDVPDAVYFERCGFYNLAGVGIDFTVPLAGVKSQINNCKFAPADSFVGLMHSGVRFPNDRSAGDAGLTGGDRFIWGSMALTDTFLVDATGTANLNIFGCEGGVIMDATCTKVSIVCCRLAAGFGNSQIVYNGVQNCVIGCQVNANVLVSGGSSDGVIGLNPMPWDVYQVVDGGGLRMKILDVGYDFNDVSSSPASNTLIRTRSFRIQRVNFPSAITGMILEPGLVRGREFILQNNASGSSSITFATDAVSNVQNGLTTVIPAKTAMRFIWDDFSQGHEFPARWWHVA